MQGNGGALAKQGLVFAGEAAEVPEPVPRRNLSHGCRVRQFLAQCPPCQMQTAEQQVALWPHPELLLTADPQGPVGNADRLTDFRNVKRLIRMLLHDPAEPAHDQLVLPLGYAVLARLAVLEAANHRRYESLFQAICGIAIGDDFRRGFRQMPGSRVQPLEHCKRT